MGGIHDEHRQVEEDVAEDHRLDEPQVLPQVADHRGEPPHPRPPPAAVEADLVVDPHQLAAGGAENGAGALAAEHGGVLYQGKPRNIVGTVRTMFGGFKQCFEPPNIVLASQTLFGSLKQCSEPPNIASASGTMKKAPHANFAPASRLLAF